MGYPLDLDEYEEERLIEEINRRVRLQEQGLCDYCERSPDTDPCKFPERHSFPIKNKRSYRSGRRVSDLLRDKLLRIASKL